VTKTQQTQIKWLKETKWMHAKGSSLAYIISWNYNYFWHFSPYYEILKSVTKWSIKPKQQQ
jgi:hypothetical protein